MVPLWNGRFSWRRGYLSNARLWSAMDMEFLDGIHEKDHQSNTYDVLLNVPLMPENNLKAM